MVASTNSSYLPSCLPISMVLIMSKGLWGIHTQGRAGLYVAEQLRGCPCRPLSKTVRFNVLRVIPAGASGKKGFSSF